MLVCSVAGGIVLNANGLHQEAIVALITMLSVIWALFIYLRVRRMG
jgi:hypothetical protein